MIVIIDYNIGNLGSVKNTLDKLRLEAVISYDKKTIQNADILILPGVGAAGEGMKNLKERNLDLLLINEAKKKPIIGICLGMQLFFDFSEENNVPCLGLISGKVKKFGTDFKVPQIGWNQVKIQSSPIVSGSRMKTIIGAKFPAKRDPAPQNKMQSLGEFYFVNSYYCEPSDPSTVFGVTNYGIDFCSIVKKDNLIGMQFHPEKSGQTGLTLLKNSITQSLRGALS